MRKQYLAVALGLAAVAVAALGACGGDDDSSSNTLVAKKAAPASLAADDPAWSKASAITIKTGSAMIVMKKDGTITIEGKDVSVNAKGKFVGKASGEVTWKGSKINQN